MRTSYDALRRPTDLFLGRDEGGEATVGRVIYGETRPDPESDNLRGKVVQIFDQAGVASSDRYEFKNNIMHGQRQLPEGTSRFSTGPPACSWRKPLTQMQRATTRSIVRRR